MVALFFAIIYPMVAQINNEIPHNYHPNPYMKRDSFLCLNGQWDFEISQEQFSHKRFPRKIMVPFSVETSLSGIKKAIKPHQYLHYRKRFEIPETFINKGRVLLHFEAIDQVADIYLNGCKICHHAGGYDPIVVDCLELVPGQNEIIVDVCDDVQNTKFCRGKQAIKSHGIWYTMTSGIYGSVWLESVPKQCIESLEIVPNFDDKSVSIEVKFEGLISSGYAEVSFLGKPVNCTQIDLKTRSFYLKVDSYWREWTPEFPNLYDLKIKVNEDEVFSYFGMRKFGTISHNGFNVFALNNKPYFLTGVLDQGYWQESGLTPPSLNAIERDILSMKAMGFNCIRKHIKVEPLSWYAAADRKGMIVIQDMVNNGKPPKFLFVSLCPFFNIHIDDIKHQKKLGSSDPESQSEFIRTSKSIIKRLYNVPCIAAWTLFNEGWGQFNAKQLSENLLELDSTRLIDSTSGWFDVGAGNFSSHHVYFKKVKLCNDHIRILSLSEFGGYSFRVDGHCFSKKSFGYKRFKTKESLMSAISNLYLNEVKPLIEKEGLSVAIFTQLSDVEHETNGLLTYDRVVTKVDQITMKMLNDEMRFR